MPLDESLTNIGRQSASYRVARGVLELFVDSSTADRQLNRFFNDTDQGMTASAQRAARLFSLGFTRGTDGIIRDAAGRIIDPNDPRLVINSQRAGRRFWGNFYRVGRQQSQRFFDGLFGAVGLDMMRGMPPQAQAAIASAFAIAIYNGAALIGAALNAVILAALGGGVMAVGIASAMRDPMVSKAMDGIGAQFQDMFREMGKPFIDPMITGAQTIKSRIMLMVPEFKEMAQELSVLVEPLANGIDLFLSNIMPGLRSAISAAAPVLREFINDLPMLGSAISEMFQSFADGDGAVKGMRATMMLLAATLKAIGDIIEYLSDEFDDATEAWEAIFRALGHIPGAGGPFKELAEWLDRFNNTSEDTVGMLGYTEKGFQEVSSATGKAAREAENLKNKWAELWGQAMSLDQAMIAYQQSIDDLTASIKENGRTLDIGTDKGRNNAKALLEVAENAKRVRDAEVAAGGSAEDANRKFAAQIEELRRMALAAGLSKDQVDALLRKYMEYANAPVVNKTITTTVKTVYKTEGTRPGGLNNIRYFERWGGVVAAQHGMVSQADVFAGGPSLIKFAEPETGGEAFIPRRGNRARNMAILRIAADWNNADVSPRPSGAQPLPMAGEVAARGRQARGGAGRSHDGWFGPYVIQVGDRTLAAFVVDVVTGMPKQVAALADEGRRMTSFANPGIARL